MPQSGSYPIRQEPWTQVWAYVYLPSASIIQSPLLIGPVILLDLEYLHTSTPVPSKPSPRPSTPPAGATNDIVDIVDKASAPHVVMSLSTLRAVLSVVLTFGLDPVVDNICNELGLFEIPSSTCAQLGSVNNTTLEAYMLIQGF